MEAKQRGDTLIEVLVSIAILSLIIVGGNTLMNFGSKNAINAVEHTQVRNLIVGQSELLRYMRDNAEPGGTDPVSQAWATIVDGGGAYVNANNASPINSCVPASTRQEFYLTVDYSSPAQPPDINVRNYTGNADPEGRPYAVPGRGLWIEGVASSGPVSYIDFQIRACWEGTGSSVPQQSNTIVRLYTD